MKFIRLSILLSIGALLMATTLLLNVSLPETAEAAPTAVTCNNGYTAMTYATGLSSPDGLAMSPDGLVYVAEEGAGEITRINADTTQTAVLTGLSSPEGIAFDAAGNLYVVEDKKDGRLIRQDTNGATTTLASNLLAPEGVVVAENGTIYVTESGLQLIDLNNPYAYVDLDKIDPTDIDFSNPSNPDLSGLDFLTDTLISRVTSINPVSPFTATTLISATPEYVINETLVGGTIFPPLAIYDLSIELDFLSFSGITIGGDGQVYVSAELSNLSTTEMTTTNYMITETTPAVTIRNVTVETNSTRSVLQVNPNTGASVTHVTHLTATEGLRFSSNGDHPLYIVQEDASGLAELGRGRLSVATSEGVTSTLCDGFSTIEDVLVGPDGVLYVSEDGTGRIVQITPPDIPDTGCIITTTRASQLQSRATADSQMINTASCVFLPLIIAGDS